MIIRKWVLSVCTGALVSLVISSAFAQSGWELSCAGLPNWSVLKGALQSAVGVAGNGGLGFNMWGTIVANDGTVCAVAFSGAQYTNQWLGSRVISAQKANTANDFSLGKGTTPSSSIFGSNGLALSTANLYSAVQPGGSLYGLQHSNPVDPITAYGSENFQAPVSAFTFGTPNDPMVGTRVGGVNVFGGGLALYSSGGNKVGGVGVSGDTSCTDHMVAWRLRHFLGLDHLSGLGVVPGNTPQYPDNIIFDITANTYGGTGISASGFGHPNCINPPTLMSLPHVQP
jgi:uncharacterized protein GlcG (DUF336 family)